MIFSDETKINRFNLGSRSWYWIGDGKRIGPQHVYHIMKHGGGLVMVWSCMIAFGLGAWYRNEGSMDRHLYKFILENFWWSIVHNYNLDPSRLFFQ